MKISYKILIINFAIVLLVLGSTAAAFYSIMYNVLARQQTKFILDSANDFLYTYRENVAALEDDYRKLKIKQNNGLLSGLNLDDSGIDFIIYTSENEDQIIKYSSKTRVNISEQSTLKEFFYNYPYTITNYFQTKEGYKCYYGKLITNEILNNFAKRIRSEIAIIYEGTPSQISNEIQNQKYIYALSQAYSELSRKANFEFSNTASETSDILVTIYKPAAENSINETSFLIFSSLNSAEELNAAIRDILIIIGFSGVFISAILTFLFTSTLRRRIGDLSQATQITKEGNFSNRIKVKSNDELGELASAFNTMLDELEKNQRIKNEYADFITLLNQNPTLNEITTAVLKKMTVTCGFSVGAIYSINNEDIEFISSYGLYNMQEEVSHLELFKSVIRNKEPMQLYLDNEIPVAMAILKNIHLKYLLILPIIYNNKVISIIEMSGEEPPSADANEYLSRIQEQLAIGLTNALAFVQLEKLVSELKVLNDDYQKQNLQIRKQNETLIDLHNSLKEKADELAVQKEKAEESTKLKSQFLASMSHELRTPLNSIVGLSELILSDSLFKGKHKERLEVVLKSSKRLMILINDILDLSKIEAGKLEIKEENISLHEMLKEIEFSVSPLFFNKNIKFRIFKELSTKVIITADRGKVTQVLINLIGNAVKFTEKGNVDLRVYKKDDMLTFDVADTGIGISQEDQDIIFEEFRQIDGTISKKYSGTGLGLTICKKIADSLKGTLHVKSSLDEGSTFTFSVPFKYVGDIQLINNSRKIIQLIEQNPEIRYNIGDYLSGLDYEVVYSENAEAGFLDAIKHQPFSIVIDNNLPNKDGWELIKYIKEDNRTKNIPIVMFVVLPEKNVGFGLNVFDFVIEPLEEKYIKAVFAKLERTFNKTTEKIYIVDSNEKTAGIIKNFSESKLINQQTDIETAFADILQVQPGLIIINPLLNEQNILLLLHKLRTSIETKNIPVIITLPQEIEKYKDNLTTQLENTAKISKTHPLDVLKVIRDRIKSEELSSLYFDNKTPETELDNDEEITSTASNELLGDILVIDDDPDTLFTINEILVSCGFSTHLARGGKEGLKILESTSPDLILLDIMMPEMDGFQTIRLIKERENLADIPVFAVTAKAMLQDKDIILRNGFADYIPKPIDSTMLRKKIKQAISKLKFS